MKIRKVQQNELIKESQYIINFNDGFGDDHSTYVGLGVFNGEIEDIGGICGNFTIEEDGSECWFPLDNVYIITE